MTNIELRTVRSLLNAFNDSVCYCHWKSNQHFNDALFGVDDLDILIDRNQYADVVNVLNALKFKRFIIPSARAYVGIEDWLGFDAETGKIFHLHLHNQLVLGEKHLKGFLVPLEKRILTNRRWDACHQVYMSSYFDEMLLLILRTAIKTRKRDLLKGSILGKSSKAEYEWLIKNCPDFCQMVKKESWLTERIIKDIDSIVRGGFTWMRCNRMKRHVYRDLAPYSQGSRLYNTLKRNYRELNRICLEIKKRYLNCKYTLLRRRPVTGGVTIAFLGSDGAGKSSTIEEIRKWLFQVMDVRYFYLGSGDGQMSLLRKPLKIAMSIAQRFGMVKKSNNFSDAKLQKVENDKHRFVRKLWVYTLAKERIVKLKQANRCRLRGFIVLTDRYPQSEFPGLCDGRRLDGDDGFAGKMESEALRIAELCPPDLCIKMIVSPGEAVKRKPGELDEETSANLTERVKSITFSNRTKCVEIDSDQPQKQVWLEVKKTIWEII